MSLDIPREGPGRYRSSPPFELRHASTHRPLLVVVPDRRLLTIYGAGPSEAADFHFASTLLRRVDAIVRRMVMRSQRAEPVRSVLEVSWSLEPGMTVDEIVEELSGPTPRWQQMVELPHTATESIAADAIDQTMRSEGRHLPLVRLLHVVEGPAVQILHLGSDDLSTSIAKLHGVINDEGLRTRGTLHELVMADAHTVGRDRARSILRLPIAYE